MVKTALVIVDMVRDFTDPEGLVFYPENQNILPRIKKVLDESRKHDLLVVFLQHCNRKDKIDRKAQAMRPNCIEGTFGIEIDPMLEVDEKKVVTDMFPKPGVKVNEGSSIILYYNNN